jgi:hypothetical protein
MREKETRRGKNQEKSDEEEMKKRSRKRKQKQKQKWEKIIKTKLEKNRGKKREIIKKSETQMGAKQAHKHPDKHRQTSRTEEGGGPNKHNGRKTQNTNTHRQTDRPQEQKKVEGQTHHHILPSISFHILLKKSAWIFSLYFLFRSFSIWEKKN